MAAPTSSRGAPGHAAGRPRTPRSGSGPSSGPSSSSDDSRGRRYAPAHEGADYDRQGYCLKHVSSFLLKTVSSPQSPFLTPLVAVPSPAHDPSLHHAESVRVRVVLNPVEALVRHVDDRGHRIGPRRVGEADE